MTLVHQGQIGPDGKLTLVNPETFRRALRGLANAPVDITIRRHRKTRSDRQNRFYWHIVIGLTAEYCGYQPEEMHDAWKWRLLRLEDPDHLMPTVRSTASLTTQEFESYIDQIRTVAATELGVVIPLPNEVQL
jgi:hypothetical protein